MSVIPFGLIGAIFGHVLFDEAVSMMSMFGLIALAGVVVNDSLIMMDFINKAREAGLNRIDAVIQSGTQRNKQRTVLQTNHRFEKVALCPCGLANFNLRRRLRSVHD